MSSVLKNAAQSACWHALIPLARICIRFGISYREFQEFSKSAFVAAARKELSTSEKKLTSSRVSARTGLSRRELRKADAQSPAFTVQAGCLPLTDVLTEWASSNKYIGTDGEPVALSFSDGPLSIKTLVQEKAPGLSPRAALDELLAARCVIDCGDVFKLRSRHLVPDNVTPAVIEQGGRALFALGNTVAENLSAPEGATRQFEQMAVSTRLRAGGIQRFLAYMRTSAHSFLEIADDWISAHESGHSPVDEPRITGVGVYTFDVEGTEFEAQ